MPCPHNEITIVQRSQRQSAVAAAAYQSGEKLFCEYDQEEKHYPEKRGIVHNEILLPANAPQEYADRNTLWNAAEAVEKQWNSQLARRWVLTIPREIPLDQYAVLVREFCEQQFVSKGMIADFAIHDPYPPGHNPHAHVMLTIQGCFDNINHEKLIEILSRKIKDSRFLNIIRQFLKAGYIENWKYNATYSGSPQGGICSPILANIYLNELDKKFREIAERFDKPRSAYQTPEYHAASKELKRLSYWIDHTADEAARQELIDQHRAQKEAMRNLPCKPADNKKFTFVRYADDWLAGVCGTKAECEDLKAEIAEFLSTELKLTLSEEKTLITHSSEKVRFIGYDICVRRNQEVKGHRMKNGTWRKSRTLHMKVALSVPHTEKIEKFMFAKKVIRQKENGEFQPIHRAGLLNLADYEIVEQYNAEARGLCNYYNLACDYHTLDYFCYLMEYSCLKTIANKHKTSIRKIIRQYKDGKTWSVPYETKAGTKRVRPVKIADCKRGEASDIIYQRKKFSWKTTIRQRLNARVCELCGCKEADLYEVHVIRNLNELGNSDWETVMKKKRRKTLVVCSKCHERIHRH